MRVAKSLLTVVASCQSALVGIDMTALSVFGGALGVGLGFGLQKIASNYVSGFIILLDRSIRIGNVIPSTPTRRGDAITTRYTVLRTRPAPSDRPNEYLVGNIVQQPDLFRPPVRLSTSIGLPTAPTWNWPCA